MSDDQQQQTATTTTKTWLDPATACVPTWSCDNEYYEALVKFERVYLKTDPIKGKGLFAREDINQGENVLVETALCCSQNVDDFESGIPICGSCMRSLETPKQIIRRVCNKREVMNALPKNYAGFKTRNVVACKNANRGCTMVFCSDRCHDDAWRKHHYVGCSGVMSAEAEKAYEEIRTDGWVHNGVDLSDTVFLGFRFFSFVLTRHRLHRMPLSLAFFPVGQLIKSPINKFTFSYLLLDEYEELISKKKTDNDADDDSSDKKKKEEALRAKESPAEKRSRRWKMFVETMANPKTHPAVKYNLDAEDPEKTAFLTRCTKLVHTALMMTEAEANFLSSDVWSNLLGAILLNGQERSPHSQFTEFMQHWKKQGEDGETQAKKFAKLVKENAPGVSVHDFETSTRGQGVYTVGSCFNHSCKPNLQIHYAGEDDEMLCAVALRDIKKDEELYISYIDESLNIAERQQQLFEHYLFTCTCEKCEEDKANKARHHKDPNEPSTVSDSEKNNEEEAESD
jgi:hypothetical protein